MPKSHNASLSPRTNWNKVTAADIEKYNLLIQNNLPCFNPLVFECIKSDCTIHQKELDVYCESLFSCIKDAALHSLLQSHTCGNRKVTPGWNKFVLKHRHAAVFWNRVWHEAGSPSTGVLSQLKKLAKNRYKYSVRKVKRRKDHIVNRIVSSALSNKNNRLFWNEINKFKRPAKPNTASLCPTIDGLSNDLDICSTFSSKLKDILNLNDCSSCVDHLLVASSDLLAIKISPSVVSECIAKLDKNKSDGSSFSSNNLLVASTALCDFLSKLFTSILRHGYMPKLIRNCSVLPIPKPHKDPTVSDNYRPIALAPNLSKILESCILELYSNYFLTSDLQL